MKCPQCNSLNVRKNGHQQGKQRFECKDCGRIFRESHELRGYHPQVKKVCLEMYLNGTGFRGIERVTGVHHTTIMKWVKESAESLPEDEEGHYPIVAELDELQTYVGRKSHKIWVWTAIDHYVSGILAIQIGDRSGQTFEKLWERIKLWESRRYLTDGYCVYANYIDPEKHLVLPKTQLTRVEGDNTRLRHYLARLHRATLCYSKAQEMLRYSIRLLMYYLRFGVIPLAS
jgi:IS1 family transposase/transposase-like protein